MINFPKETVTGREKFSAISDVYLEAGHICIRNNIAEPIFGNQAVILCAWYKKDNTFFAAPADEDLFRKLHKSTQYILKMKNAAGDRSITVQELLLDNDISDHDRDLEFTAEEALNILKIKF